MIAYIKLLIIVFILTNISISFGQDTKLSGKITDKAGNPIISASVFIAGTSKGTISDLKGYYQLNIPAGNPVEVSFAFLGYSTKIITLFPTKNQQEINQDIVLLEEDKFIDEIDIMDKRINEIGTVKINPKIISTIPNISGSGIETLIKTLGGSSNNELSSQYTVRGGNFDENLVYVNDIEVYRPFLIRSGQQEGLSFLNSDMVSSIAFSAGGFDARYGDKMSSVLDIKYKKPREFAASVSGSLLGASVNLEGADKNQKFTIISGLRYKTSQYLLNSMEVDGDYKPSFIDFQTYLTYKLNPKLELGLLGNIAQNKYEFTPEDRSTSFGTFSNALNLYIDFEGQEIDKYQTLFGALAIDYRPSDKLLLKLIGSTFNTVEQETFDIESYYMLSMVDRTKGTNGKVDSALNLGIGADIEHARNFLEAKVTNFAHKGFWFTGGHSVLWGLNYQIEKIYDRISEWQMIDSAGYSINLLHLYNPDNVILNKSVYGTNKMTTSRITAFIQETYKMNISNSELNITGGVRLNYWDYNNKTLISPRASVALHPGWNRDYVFRFATGYYYQPPFYRELRKFDGTLVDNAKAQKSIHFVLGSDYTFQAWNRQFKLVTELFYKHMDNIIPYEIDNVRIRYFADQRAKAYATGLEFKINGEFVRGAESWASISFLRTYEDIYGDYYYRYFDADTNEVYARSLASDSMLVTPGYIPRPTDQFVNVGIFFQDYLPGNDKFKMHLTLFYGSRLPYGPPQRQRWQATHRMPAYLRTDIGFSYVIKPEDIVLPPNNPFRFFKTIWITAEVFNLLGINNVISYKWLSVVPNSSIPNPDVYSQYAVPNRLTSRRINVKLILNF